MLAVVPRGVALQSCLASFSRPGTFGPGSGLLECHHIESRDPDTKRFATYADFYDPFEIDLSIIKSANILARLVQHLYRADKTNHG